MLLVWILVAVSSGSVFCSSFFKKRWEEAVPATVFSMILVLYTFALLDILKAGVAVLVSRNEVTVSLQDRSQYTELVDLVQRNQDDDKVETLFLLSQGSNGSDYWRLRYLLRRTI